MRHGLKLLSFWMISSVLITKNWLTLWEIQSSCTSERNTWNSLRVGSGIYNRLMKEKKSYAYETWGGGGEGESGVRGHCAPPPPWQCKNSGKNLAIFGYNSGKYSGFFFFFFFFFCLSKYIVGNFRSLHVYLCQTGIEDRIEYGKHAKNVCAPKLNRFRTPMHKLIIWSLNRFFKAVQKFINDLRMDQ